MASKLNRIGKDIMSAMENASGKGTSAYDTTAEVRRIEGDTAWVHIAGGVDETPVKLTIAAKAGDSVQVRVGGGRAWITGNATAPPTDDKEAKLAKNIANTANYKAVQAQTTAEEAQAVADQAQTVASEASSTASEAYQTARGSVSSDTLHYLATSQSTGVTRSTSGWTTSIQTITADKPYLWIYHIYTKANGSTTHTNPVIIGTFGKDGTSVTILGSYNTLAELQAAHPTGSLGDSYMVAGDLYVWNGSAWENVGQIQGPKGDKGDTGDDGISVTGVYPQYYLSTSASQLSGGENWVETLNYISGRYIWTRERITYSSGPDSYSSAVYNSALTTAWINANSARQIAEDTEQHFWTTETGSDTGAHITEKTQEDFLADPDNGGGNLLARSNGIAVRDGLSEMATFAKDGMRIFDENGNPLGYFLATESRLGRDGESQIILKPDGQSLVTNNIKWFEIKKSGNPTAEATDATMTYNFVKTATLPNTPITGTKIVVDVGGDTLEFTAGTSATKNAQYHATSGWVTFGTVAYNASAKSFTFTPSSSVHANDGITSIDYRYSSNAADLGVFQFGNRRNGTTGNGSVSMGRGLLSVLPNEVAFGSYNESGNNALSIGDGTAQTPHNLFDIKKNGVVNANGVSGAKVGFHANNNNGYGEGFCGWGTNGTSFGVYAGGWLVHKNRSTGDVYLNGVNTNTLVTTRPKAISLGTIAANGYREDFDLAPEVANFQPIGILDYYMSGSGSSYCFPYSVRVDPDTGSVDVGVRNLRGSATGSVSITVKVLYRMNKD